MLLQFIIQIFSNKFFLTSLWVIKFSRKVTKATHNSTWIKIFFIFSHRLWFVFLLNFHFSVFEDRNWWRTRPLPNVFVSSVFILKSNDNKSDGWNVEWKMSKSVWHNKRKKSKSKEEEYFSFIFGNVNSLNGLGSFVSEV